MVSLPGPGGLHSLQLERRAPPISIRWQMSQANFPRVREKSRVMIAPAAGGSGTHLQWSHVRQLIRFGIGSLGHLT